MSAERFDHLEKMLAQLILMVGHNNAVTDELCQRMDRLETRMDSLETKLDNLEAKVNSLETQVNNGFEGLTGMVHLLGEKMEAIPRIEAKLDVLNERLFEQEAGLIC